MISLLLAFVIGTWNGNRFPYGSCECRARPEVENARIEAAGRFLADGMKSVDPTGTNDVVLVLNEMRDQEAVEKLLKATGRKDLKIAAITKYRLGDQADEQQDVVATTLPVVKSRWARWRYDPAANPPRGYAFAAVVVEPTVTAHVYAVHLKANTGGKDPAVATTNRLKRAAAIGQFLRIADAGVSSASERKRPPVILAGDFNADLWSERFANETIFTSLENAGFANSLAQLPADSRRTHVSGQALDYVMTRGFAVRTPPAIVPSSSLSDHHAVFVRVEPETGSSNSSFRPAQSAYRADFWYNVLKYIGIPFHERRDEQLQR